MRAYYNDNERFVCDWLQNLMDAGHITAGKIDDRSIHDVPPNDLEGYERVHFFAGIGGWDYALNLAGWEGPVWTGSCPCQPLSSAGKRKGHADERHLWPAFQSLIAKCKPPVVFGEQVASKDGREWLSAVRADLESMGYACGAADLPAAGVGALHQRHRLWWVAYSRGQDVSRSKQQWQSLCCQPGEAPAEYRYKGLSQGLWDRADTCITVWVDGLPRPVELVRAYGNAIVPQVAAEFIMASHEAMAEQWG